MKKLLLFIALLFLWLLSSCYQEENDAGNNNKPEGSVSFKFILPESEINTRSVPAEAGENQINDLTLLFFEPTSNGNGNFVGYYKVPASQLPLDNASSFNLDISLEGLNKTDAYSILVMANVKGGNLVNDPIHYPDDPEENIVDTELDNFLTNISNMTESEVIQSTLMEIEGVGDEQGNNSKALYSNNLPMSAQGSKEENVDNVELKLIRSLCRFDVTNNASDYELVSVSIWNAYTSTYMWGSAMAGYDMDRTRRFYGVDADTQAPNSIKGRLYAFENVWTSPDQNDDKTTCLIIGLEAQDDNIIYYYRLNINSRDMGQYLKRNNAYQTTITAVRAKGELTEKDAYMQGQFLLDVSINAWDRDEDGLIIRDGDNLLALPTRKAIFGPSAEERQYYVYTLGNGTLEMYTLEMPQGINARLEGNNLFISVEDFGGETRKGSIELRFAGMKGVIEIVQSGQTEKFLTLNYTNIPPYPAGLVTNMIPQNNPVIISSSGTWTATIMGGNDFTFTLGQNVPVITGYPDGTISAIYTVAQNTEEEAKTNFVLITLDEDPDNYRNVIVLTQSGTGNFTLIPNNNSVSFTAQGGLELGTNNVDEFSVTPSVPASDTWTVTLTGINANMFKLTSPGKTEGNQLTFGPTDNTTENRTFKIVPIGENTSENTYNASVEILHNGNQANKKTISVTQRNYGFSVNPLSFNVTPVGGTQKITIRCAVPDAKVTASITTNSEAANLGLIPTFSNGTQTLTSETITNGVYVMDVIVPPVTTHLLTANPQSVVTITIDDTPLSASVNITQENIVFPSSLYSQTTTNTYGRWDGSGGKFYRFAQEMTNSSNFGPTGTVWAPSTIGGTDSFSSSQVLNNARIINLNHTTLASGTLYTLLTSGDDKIVKVISEHDNNSQRVFNSVNLSSVYNLDGDGSNDVSASTVRTINSAPAWVRNTKLWAYLVGGEGPFGSVNPANVSLRPEDANYAVLTRYPSTFIPLILNPNTNAYPVVGIDPTNRLLWVGDTELFADYNNNYAAANTDNMTFVRNLIAWVVNTSLYGDAFNNQFKIE